MQREQAVHLSVRDNEASQFPVLIISQILFGYLDVAVHDIHDIAG